MLSKAHNYSVTTGNPSTAEVFHSFPVLVCEFVKKASALEVEMVLVDEIKTN